MSEWRTSKLTNRNFLAEAKEHVKTYTSNDKYFNLLYKLLLMKNERKR